MFKSKHKGPVQESGRGFPKASLNFDVVAWDYLGNRKTDYFTHLNGGQIELGVTNRESLDYVASLINRFSEGRTDISVTSKATLESDLVYWGAANLTPEQKSLGPNEPLAKGCYSLMNLVGVKRPLTLDEMKDLMRKVLKIKGFHA